MSRLLKRCAPHCFLCGDKSNQKELKSPVRSILKAKPCYKFHQKSSLLNNWEDECTLCKDGHNHQNSRNKQGCIVSSTCDNAVGSPSKGESQENTENDERSQVSKKLWKRHRGGEEGVLPDTSCQINEQSRDTGDSNSEWVSMASGIGKDVGEDDNTVIRLSLQQDGISSSPQDVEAQKEDNFDSSSTCSYSASDNEIIVLQVEQNDQTNGESGLNNQELVRIKEELESEASSPGY